MFRSLTLIPVLMVGLALPAIADDLPKSGSFDLQNGLKFIGDTTQVAEKHFLTTGKTWGVSFNSAGKGPLHMATFVCTNDFEVIEGTGTGRGKCAWSDADSDKIFAEWSGKFTPTSTAAGDVTITSGTGKFAGIQGKGPFHCSKANANGQQACMQHFDYQITATGAAK
jgi:hypothetical protein